MRYEAEFTLEGGAEIEAADRTEALQLARREAARQYGRRVAQEMTIAVRPHWKGAGAVYCAERRAWKNAGTLGGSGVF